MQQRIGHIALVVRDYDEALDFYINKLDFDLLEDTKLDEHKRWVVISPKGAKECTLLLAKAANKEQESSIGNQTEGRVFLFLFTDDFERDYSNLQNKGVNFVRPPHNFDYGRVAVFEDLYGNLFDLIEPTHKNKGNLS